MRTVHKFDVPLRSWEFGSIRIPNLPIESIPRLIAEDHNGDLKVWIELDPDNSERREILHLKAVPTGAPVPRMPEGMQWYFLRSLQRGAYVWHFYYIYEYEGKEYV